MSHNIGVQDSNISTDSFGQALENGKEPDTTNQKYFTYSWHPKVTADLSKQEGGKITRGWILDKTSWQEDKIKEVIRTRSYLPSQLNDGYKIKSNVRNVFAYSLDFDKGSPTIEEFKVKTEKWGFSWVLHTTTNHMKNKKDKDGNEIHDSAIEKFRVIIPLDEPISLSALEASAVFWEKMFPTIDPTCFDGNRYFMVNPNAEVLFKSITGVDDSPVFLNPVRDGVISESFMKKKAGRPKLSKSNNTAAEDEFSPDTEVMLKDGNMVLVGDIKDKTEIFCPFCDHTTRQHPDKANAFIDFNNAGQMYISCSSEHKTYWIEMDAIIPEKSKLFFNEDVGFVARLDDKTGSYKVFKNNDDWLSYCHHNNIKPDCKTYLPRRTIIFDPQ